MTTTTTETAKEVLRGYGCANEAALASLMDVQDWQRIARPLHDGPVPPAHPFGSCHSLRRNERVSSLRRMNL